MAAERVTVLDLMGQAAASVPSMGAAAPVEPPPRVAAPAPDEDMEARIERLSDELDNVPEPGRSVAEQLLAAVLELHGSALVQILELIDEDSAHKLLDDQQVASLLLIHDLYPVPLEERVIEALDSVRPYMESHGGDVELLGLEDGVARLRLEGSCSGCAASASTLELAIKKALDEAAPDLLGLEVEGVAEPPSRGPGISGTPLPLADAGVGEVSGWLEVDGIGDLPEGATALVGDGDVFVANVTGTLLAYRDACPACASSLAGAAVDGATLTCPGCAARFDLPRAGRGVDDEDLQLGPVPLLREGQSRVRIALGR